MSICSICLEDDTQILFKTDCNHYFHKGCFIKWLKKSMTCPLCRQVINPINLFNQAENLINIIYKFTNFISVENNTFEINGIKIDNISEQLTNQSPQMWEDISVVRKKIPIYCLENDEGKKICIDFYTRQLFLFSKMNLQNLVKNNSLYSIYYTNTGNLKLSTDIFYTTWYIMYEWMNDLVSVLSESYDFIFEDCINTLIMDIIIITINEKKITKKSMFQTIIICAVYNIILYLKKIEINKNELIWFTDYSSEIEQFEKFSEFQKNYIEKNIIFLN